MSNDKKQKQEQDVNTIARDFLFSQKDLLNYILSFIDLASSIKFLSTCKTLFNYDYLWQQQLGVSPNEATEVRAAIKAIKVYEAEKKLKIPSIKMAQALKKLLELNETQKWTSLFLSEAYLFGYGAKKPDIKFAFTHLKEAANYYQCNKSNNKFLNKKLADTLYEFLYQLIEYVSNSSLEFDKDSGFDAVKNLFYLTAKIYKFLKHDPTYPITRLTLPHLSKYKNSKKSLKISLLDKKFLTPFVTYLSKLGLNQWSLKCENKRLSNTLLDLQIENLETINKTLRAKLSYEKISDPNPKSYLNQEDDILRKLTQKIEILVEIPNKLSLILQKSEENILIQLVELTTLLENLSQIDFEKFLQTKELKNLNELLFQIIFAIEDIEREISLDPLKSNIYKTQLNPLSKILELLSTIKKLTNDYIKNLSTYINLSIEFDFIIDCLVDHLEPFTIVMEEIYVNLAKTPDQEAISILSRLYKHGFATLEPDIEKSREYAQLIIEEKPVTNKKCTIM